jgi:hypothetical protein
MRIFRTACLLATVFVFLILSRAAAGEESNSTGPGPDKGIRPPVVPAKPASVAVSADGKLRATVSDGPNLHLCDAATGKELRQVRCSDAELCCVALAPDGRVVAAADQTGSVYLWETATGKELHRLAGEEVAIVALAFSPSGKALVAIGNHAQDALGLWVDGELYAWEVVTGKEIRRLRSKTRPLSDLTYLPDGQVLARASGTIVLVWQPTTGRRIRPTDEQRQALTDASHPGRPFFLVKRGSESATANGSGSGTSSGMPAARQEALWAALADADAAKAYQAIGMLTAVPGDAESFLAARLHPVPTDAGQRIDGLIHDLDDNRWAVRDHAEGELESLGELAEGQLRKTLQKPPSLEVRRRVEWLLERLDNTGFSSETLRNQRAVEALEELGTADARRLLETLAAGAPNARLTQDAAAAVRRMAGRS